MMPNNYILVNRTPVPEPDLSKWAHWMETADRIVAQTEIGASLVSTVFLGTDHSILGSPPPILFETMIFTDGEAEDYQERCSTWFEAEFQHKQATDYVKTRSKICQQE